MTRNDVLKRLAAIRIDLVETVLGAAVDREAAIDLNLKKDPALQKRLKSFVRGLSILYFYSFLQSHVTELEWSGIKGPNGANRSEFSGVDWDRFDT